MHVPREYMLRWIFITCGESERERERESKYILVRSEVGERMSSDEVGCCRGVNTSGAGREMQLLKKGGDDAKIVSVCLEVVEVGLGSCGVNVIPHVHQGMYVLAYAALNCIARRHQGTTCAKSPFCAVKHYGNDHMQFRQGDITKEYNEICKDWSNRSQKVISSIPPAITMGHVSADESEDDHGIIIDENDHGDSVDSADDDYLDVPTHFTYEFPSASDVKKAEDDEITDYMFTEYLDELVDRLKYLLDFHKHGNFLCFVEFAKDDINGNVTPTALATARVSEDLHYGIDVNTVEILLVEDVVHIDMKLAIACSAQHTRYPTAITAMFCADIAGRVKIMSVVHRELSASIAARHSRRPLALDNMKLGPQWLSCYFACLPPRRTGFNPLPGHSGFSHVEIVHDDDVDQRVFSVISCSPLIILAPLHTHISSPSSAVKTSITRQAANNLTLTTTGQNILSIIGTNCGGGRGVTHHTAWGPHQGEGEGELQLHQKCIAVILNKLCRSTGFLPLLKRSLKFIVSSPPTKANRIRIPVGSLPDFNEWKSCRMMPLVGGFPRGSPISPALTFRRCSITFASPSSSASLERKEQSVSLEHERVEMSLGSRRRQVFSRVEVLEGVGVERVVGVAQHEDVAGAAVEDVGALVEVDDGRVLRVFGDRRGRGSGCRGGRELVAARRRPLVYARGLAVGQEVERQAEERVDRRLLLLLRLRLADVAQPRDVGVRRWRQADVVYGGVGEERLLGAQKGFVPRLLLGARLVVEVSVADEGRQQVLEILEGLLAAGARVKGRLGWRLVWQEGRRARQRGRRAQEQQRRRVECHGATTHSATTTTVVRYSALSQVEQRRNTRAGEAGDTRPAASSGTIATCEKPGLPWLLGGEQANRSATGPHRLRQRVENRGNTAVEMHSTLTESPGYVERRLLRFDRGKAACVPFAPQQAACGQPTSAITFSCLAAAARCERTKSPRETCCNLAKVAGDPANCDVTRGSRRRQCRGKGHTTSMDHVLNVTGQPFSSVVADRHSFQITSVASPGTILTCEDPGVPRPGIKPCLPWWEVSRLTAQPLWLRFPTDLNMSLGNLPPCGLYAHPQSLNSGCWRTVTNKSPTNNIPDMFDGRHVRRTCRPGNRWYPSFIEEGLHIPRHMWPGIVMPKYGMWSCLKEGQYLWL
ncbi:hypothetical protein PR048_002896 [Dryococelus australis]|uniref:Uncharacterized protein n=1 Tax=Dryococelus australis TaxID=614101 RepID=A0ABQ9IM22_9NEOP|nr:hypothetical protein PR048_002896 [Dryococelus australis]